MKFLIIVILSLIPVILTFSQSSKELTTVNYVDLKKYTGLWYEIALIPNSFQDDCVKNTTAEYSINEDGEIEVINSCVEADGEKNVAEGIARVVDKKTKSKLEVSFVSIFGINLFWGDYWIIGLDENYEYAVIGTPGRKYGWILGRKPELSKDQMNEAFDILRAQGYNPDNFKMSRQK